MRRAESAAAANPSAPFQRDPYFAGSQGVPYQAQNPQQGRNPDVERLRQTLQSQNQSQQFPYQQNPMFHQFSFPQENFQQPYPTYSQQQFPLPPGARVVEPPDASAYFNARFSTSSQPSVPFYYTNPVTGAAHPSFFSPSTPYPIPSHTSFPTTNPTYPTGYPTSHPTSSHHHSAGHVPPVRSVPPRVHTTGAYNVPSSPSVPIQPVLRPSATEQASSAQHVVSVIEPPVTFRLTELTLPAVYKFCKEVVKFDHKVRHVEQQYPVFKAISEDIILQAANEDFPDGRTVSRFDLSHLSTTDILSYLRKLVTPKGQNSMIQVFKSNEILRFQRQSNYDPTLLENRVMFLRDLSKYINNFEEFFRYLTDGMSVQDIINHIPAMNAKPRDCSIVEIFLNKIPGPNSDTRHNFVRSVIRHNKYSPFFASCLDRRMFVVDAFRQYLLGIRIVVGNAITQAHAALEEDLMHRDGQVPISTLALVPSYNKDKTKERSGAVNTSKRTLHSMHALAPSDEQDHDADDDYIFAHLSEDDVPVSSLHVLADLAHNQFKKGDGLGFIYALGDALHKVQGAITPHRNSNVPDSVKLHRGQKGYIATLPPACIRFLRGSCTKDNCKFSHNWKDILELCAAVQAEHARVKGHSSAANSNKETRVTFKTNTPPRHQLQLHEDLSEDEDANEDEAEDLDDLDHLDTEDSEENDVGWDENNHSSQH
jgi:hypothetical protein